MIDKTKLPTVSYDAMNEMHYEEADLINALLDTIGSGEERAVTEALEALMEHMQKHFGFEEEMLKNRGFSMFDTHRNDHARITGETRMAYMNWRNFRDREALKEFMEEEFIQWLNLHIQAMDTVAADFLKRLEDS